MHARIGNAIKNGLCVAASRHQPIDAKAGKVLRQSRLAETDAARKLACGEFAGVGEIAEDEKPSFMRERFQGCGGFSGLCREGIIDEAIGYGALVHVIKLVKPNIKSSVR